MFPMIHHHKCEFEVLKLWLVYLCVFTYMNLSVPIMFEQVRRLKKEFTKCVQERLHADVCNNIVEIRDFFEEVQNNVQAGERHVSREVSSPSGGAYVPRRKKAKPTTVAPSTPERESQPQAAKPSSRRATPTRKATPTKNLEAIRTETPERRCQSER